MSVVSIRKIADQSYENIKSLRMWVAWKIL